MRYVKKIFFVLCMSQFLIRHVPPATAEDIANGYRRMLSEARSSQELFEDKTDAICREVRDQCAQTPLEGVSMVLDTEIRLHTRSGYRFPKVKMLPAHTAFIILQSMKGYYKIRLSERDSYYISSADFTSAYSSPCDALYQKCLAGQQ